MKNSSALRAPLLAVTRRLFGLLNAGPGLLRRAVYDSMPAPYLVTGYPEQFIVSTADKVIGRELFLHGEFDFSKLQVALEILAREGLPAPSHLIDVGANIGTITIPAIKRGLMQAATAIEPHPGNLRLLRANLALNGLDDCVTVLAQAVGDQTNTTLLLKESATNSGNHSIGVVGFPVYSSRLDDLIFPPDSLLWMDIEGYEAHALKGAERLLATGIPVVCEFNPLYLQQSSGLEEFHRIFQRWSVFDLKHPNGGRTSTFELARKYRGGEEFTDIIAIYRK